MMSKNRNAHFSRWLYKFGAVILFFLAIVAMLAFVKALCVRDNDRKNTNAPADSIQVEVLRNEVKDLNRKVDSLLIMSQKEPQKVYKYLKPKKDSSIIEVNIHNK